MLRRLAADMMEIVSLVLFLSMVALAAHALQA